MIGTNRYIGSPVERIEDLRFLRGRGQFVGDLKRESMLHAAILRSPAAHGLVAAVDASAALAIAGIRAVITAKDIGPVPRIPLRLLPLPGTERFLQPVIAVERVRYVGEPVAVVLGDSRRWPRTGSARSPLISKSCRRSRIGRPPGEAKDQRVDPASHAGAMLYRALSRAECADHLYRAAHQQDPVRYLSRARPLRGLVLLRTDHRAGGARPGDRQHRDAAAQPDRRR